MKLKKVIVAPDSFKGTLSAKHVADVISQQVIASFPDCNIIKMPIADGGEGSVDTIIDAIGGKTYQAHALSPDDRMIQASYGIASNGTAIIEMAQSSGITKQDGLHPMTSSTYGFGQLILSALERGASDFILCIGGSATTDGGCGMAAALGVLFTNDMGRSFVPCGGVLTEIAEIDISGIDRRIRDSRFTVMCDVDNPLCGINGAAYIYGPQKGADPEQVAMLDEGLQHLQTVFSRCYGMDHSEVPGAGAAGGLGFGCMAFLGAELMSGSEAILKLCGFRDHIVNADLIITGEGKLDEQSFSGKVLSGIIREAGGVPIYSICGVCECDKTLLNKHSVSVYETSECATIEESMTDPAKYIQIATQKAMCDIALI